MITKINKIKNFGVFKNFENDDTIPEFKEFNLIYGWNYSGKTMLSRVFRCLEKGEKHPDYPSAEFELKTPETKYDNNFLTKPNIRVFNSDFIKENLKWDTENIEPILILGEENIKLQTELREKEEILVKDKEELEKLQNEQKQKNKAAANKAKEITNILNLGRSFDRNDLKQIIEKIKNDIEEYILIPNDIET